MRAAAAGPPAGPRVIEGNTPPVVARGQAAFRAHHNPHDLLRMDVGLTVRNSAQLDALIAAARTPGNPRYRHFLTQTQYLAQYAPTNAQAQAVRSWLVSSGLTVTGT